MPDGSHSANGLLFALALTGLHAVLDGANPVLTRCVSDAVVQVDPAGNVKPNRERGGEKIDGVVAIVWPWVASSRGSRGRSSTIRVITFEREERGWHR